MRLIIYKVLQNIENIRGISHWTSSNISERSLTVVQTLLWIWVYRYTLFSLRAADSCPPSAEVYLGIQENNTWKRKSAIRHTEIFHTVGTKWSTQRTYWNNFWGAGGVAQPIWALVESIPGAHTVGGENQPYRSDLHIHVLCTYVCTHKHMENVLK